MGRFSAATGSNIDMPVLFSNTGTAACVLEGFADVTVLDAHGAVLARAAGASGRGTYFPGGPAVPILVKPGAQAFMNLTWYDCTHPQAAQLAVDLPGSAGRVMVKFPVAGTYYMLCDTDPSYAALNRGPFGPIGVQWPPGPRYIATTVGFKVPAQVKAGSTLTYFVTLSNTDTLDYELSPCPDYIEILGRKQAVGAYGLNCGPVGHIAPGKSITFEMRLAVPATMPAGPTDVSWSLSDGRAGVPHGTAALMIT